MRGLFFIGLILCFASAVFGQVDLSKYYNSDVFKISSTEYYEDNDLAKFKEVNPEDFEGYYDRAIQKMEAELFAEAIMDFGEVIDLVEEYTDAYYLRGICFKELDSLQMAENDFNRAIELIPVYAQAYTQLGLIYWEQDEIKEAKKYFDTAYELDETDLLPVFYKCNIALFHENNIAKTKRLLNKVIRNDSTFSGAYFYKAAIKMAEGYSKSAIKNFDQAILYNPEFTGAYLWRGFLYLADDRILDAHDDFSKLVELAPENEDFWALRSFLRIEMQNYSGAVEDMISSVKLQPMNEDNYKGGRTALSEKMDLKYALTYFVENKFHFKNELINHLEKGLCDFLEEEYIEAIDSFELGMTADSTEAAPYFFTALVYEYRNDFDSASLYYTKALQRDKDIYDAYKKRGMIYEENNDFRRAYVDYSHLIRLKPESKYGYKLRGHLKLKNGDYIGATLEFKEAIKRDSSDIDVYYNRSLAFEKLQNYEASIQDLDVVLRKKSRDSEALYHKAFCTFQLGDTLNALTLCDSSMRIFSFDSFVHDLRGQIKCALGKYHEGIFAYNKAISMNSRETSFVYHRAIAYMQIKNWQAAIPDLEQIIRAFPKFGEAFYFRGLCFLETNKKEEAILDLKEAERLGYQPATEELSNI